MELIGGREEFYTQGRLRLFLMPQVRYPKYDDSKITLKSNGGSMEAMKRAATPTDGSSIPEEEIQTVSVLIYALDSLHFDADKSSVLLLRYGIRRGM